MSQWVSFIASGAAIGIALYGFCKLGEAVSNTSYRERKWIELSQDHAHACDRFDDALANPKTTPERLEKLKRQMEELEKERDLYWN